MHQSHFAGTFAIPVDPVMAKSALDQYRQHVEKLAETFGQAAAAYTADEQMQERIVRELWRKAGKR